MKRTAVAGFAAALMMSAAAQAQISGDVAFKRPGGNECPLVKG
jgi:hypothetical protein